MPHRMLRDTLSMQALASAAAVATSPGALPLLGACAWALASCDKPELLEAVEKNSTCFFKIVKIRPPGIAADHCSSVEVCWQPITRSNAATGPLVQIIIYIYNTIYHMYIYRHIMSLYNILYADGHDGGCNHWTLDREYNPCGEGMVYLLERLEHFTEARYISHGHRAREHAAAGQLIYQRYSKMR